MDRRQSQVRGKDRLGDGQGRRQSQGRGRRGEDEEEKRGGDRVKRVVEEETESESREG